MKICSTCEIQKEYSEFYSRQSMCKLCCKERDRYRDNSSRCKSYRERNKDKVKEYQSKYRSAHLEECIAYNHNRRRNAGVPNKLTLISIKIMRARPCYYCGQPGGTIDHIYYLYPKEEKTIFWNLLPACRSCNSSRGNMDFVLFLERRELWKRPISLK